ncbi:MAG: gliding motility protein GldC [Ginsengibacter sp.]
MTESNIDIRIQLDPQKIPQQISWTASDSTADSAQNAKAMFLAFWDGIEKSALRIDLWTKEMMTDEMADFYYQLFITMGDTFERATKHADLAQDIRKFALDFHTKFVEKEKAKP